MAYRVGQGYDVHRLEVGRRLVLGGVEIPYEKGLVGHSDADVLVHAVMDALLGAAGLGDIGMSFDDGDPKFKGVYSLKLLWEVGRTLRSAGWQVENADAVVVVQAPKLHKYREEMRGNIATAIGISESAVNVKFTTEERLGFTGRGEGISAHAVCLISRS
ncbi:MAG: 2-C-methyl-D-erythritol 2,4-cyclodiphosphate synthase [Defluviitaleaceae bacterium]|nr:2-C-methyl-D-erythritol 2,4-cyclodiphosphate synthase [Defluviitaleaceae bacterium]